MRWMDLSKFAKRSGAIVTTSGLLIAGMSAGFVNATPGSDVGTTGTEFITTWDTTKPGASGGSAIRLPLIAAGTYNFTVDWGDGSTDTITGSNWNTANTHSYSAPGTYTVTIEGQISGFTFNDGGDGDKLIDVAAWGPLELTYGYEGYFAGADNLNFTATDAPVFGSGASLYQAFYGADSFNSPIGHWDVSGITDISWAFQHAAVFNQDLSDWDVSNVVNMRSAFWGATAFNQDIGDWDISSVNSVSSQSMANLFQSVTLSTPVYNSILTKFAAKNKSNIYFCGGGSQYSPGPPAAARQALIDTDSWTLCTDGGETAQPGAPTSVAGTPGAGEVALDWDAAPIKSGGNPVTGYVVEQSAGPDFDAWQVAVTDTGTSATDYAVTGLSVGDYKFRVSAINSDGTGVVSGSSATISVTEPTPRSPQQLTFALPASISLNQGTLPLGASASSGLPVSYTSQTPTVCTVAGSTAALHSGGTCTIVTSQAGDEAYLPAEPVSRSTSVLTLPSALVDKCPTGSCAGADLADADLSGQYLVGVDFAGANLSSANLTGANLHGTNLAGANLRGGEPGRSKLD